MSDAIPEFEIRQQLDAIRTESATLSAAVMPHHPNCLECCAIGRCHWCLHRPESGTLTVQGDDGFVYSACRPHHQYFLMAQKEAQPHSGVDLRAGLANVSISPLTR